MITLRITVVGVVSWLVASGEVLANIYIFFNLQFERNLFYGKVIFLFYQLLCFSSSLFLDDKTSFVMTKLLS